ncbi:MAG: ATP-dependent zinc metalloprotease FtsH [candidate division Zixibacteria bacterium RBG-1]|nr:MAG: ATP-dependent zinc metalloprotease FtsH [candidate division Zixibacteria bacterium RBG-1]OGC86211.1 MAG: cell division protein FtsH [candidate division Zixibacteria bacterium RBG_19FT_COMBO_42_43]
MADSQKRADRNSRNRNYRRRVPPDQKPGKDDNQWRKASRTFFFWIMLILFTVLAIQLYRQGKKDFTEISYSEFMKQLENGNVKNVLLVKKELSGEFNEPVTKQIGKRELKYSRFKAVLPFDEPELLAKMREKNVEIRAEQESFNWSNLFLSLLPFLLLGLLWVFLLRQMQGGSKGIFSFGKSKAHLWTQDRPKVTFEDVAGADEAKQELYEIIEFLKDPGKFQKLGGKIPKGALLLGPPGTGKTLLAKAVAGEAGVPFLSMSGSDFVEMFVGVGASRVRDLFEQGKKLAPCIIFIDEIDAVGRHRGAGLGGGHDEREQTLNQLLVEMDGFESNEGVILLAATNRPDVLDPALLRPGRFDRQIVVDSPDVKGREGILRVHTRKIKLGPDIDLSVLARGTPGLSGADLANLVNEAALLAARRNREYVTMRDFEDAKDKVMMGIERKSLVISEEEKKTTAYHESGHALVGKLIPGSDPVHKVTIIPRGMALGLTSYLPIDEKHTHSKEYLETRLVHLLGGRVAEKLVFNQLTTGAGNDIEKATDIARRMVCDWGMSERLGPLTFGKKEEQIFLGREIAKHRDYSEKTAQEIDEEVKRIVTAAEKRATELLSANLNKLHKLAKALLEKEILDGMEIDMIIADENQLNNKEVNQVSVGPAENKKSS